MKRQLAHALWILAIALLQLLGTDRACAEPSDLDSVTIYGMMHKGTGGVTLDTTTGIDGFRRLTMCCLGSSGEDGVSIDLRSSNGWNGFFEPLDIPDSGMLEASFYGSDGSGLPPELSSGLRLTGVGGSNQLEAGFTGATSVTLDAYLGSLHVYHESGHTGGPKIGAPQERFPWILVAIIVLLAIRDLHNQSDTLSNLQVTLGGSTDIQIAGGPIITCDRLVITPENPTVQYVDVQKVELKGQSIPPFTIMGESMQMFGLSHEGLGNAELDADVVARRLPVRNLGSSGEDGVAVVWDDDPSGKCPRCPQAYNAVWQPLDSATTLPESASVAINVIGHVDGMPDHPIATTLIQNVGSTCEMSADFSPIGATSMKVMVYNGPMLVDSATGVTFSPVATASRMGTDCHIGRDGSCTITFGWPPPDITIGSPKSSRSVVGDAVVMIPENPTNPSNSLARIEISTSAISEITLTDESISGTYQCGDANSNGIINIADVVFLIQYIFSGGPAPFPLAAGDVNCNGIVNIADVVYLIQYIFSGGPAPCAACP